jgi:Tfp pilus assembly protein PilF
MADHVENPAQLAVAEALHLRRLGDMPAAIRLLYDTLGSNLADVTVVTTLATMLSESEQFDRADRVFQRAFAAGVHGAALYLNYATFLAHSGRVTEAAPVFRRASAEVAKELQTTTNDPELAAHLSQLIAADCNLARVRLIQGQFDAVRDLADRWLVCEQSWEDATDLVSACFSEDQIDAELQHLHDERRAAPDMVAELVDKARLKGEWFTALGIAAEACGYLAFDWLRSLDGFDAVVADVVARIDDRIDQGDVPAEVRAQLVAVRRIVSVDDRVPVS